MAGARLSPMVSDGASLMVSGGISPRMVGTSLIPVINRPIILMLWVALFLITLVIGFNFNLYHNNIPGTIRTGPTSGYNPSESVSGAHRSGRAESHALLPERHQSMVWIPFPYTGLRTDP
jgi:hypothetical protein